MAQQSLYGILLLFYGSAFLTLCHFIWKRRAIQPLKIREPHLMLISAFGGMLLTIMISLREINIPYFPCYLYIWIICIFPSLFFIPYLLRAVRLIFIYYWSQEKAKHEGGQKWSYKKNIWTKRGALLSIFFVSLVIHIFIAYVIILNVDTGENKAGCTLGDEFAIFLLMAVVYVALFILLLFKLRNVYDNFWIKKELAICTIIWIPCLFIFFACNLWEKLFWLNEWFATSTWIIIMLIGTMITSLLIPLCKTYTKEGRESFINYKQLTNKPYQLINEILSESTGTAEKYFMKYLTNCFEPDNLKFLQDVRNYEKKSTDSRAILIHKMKENYIVKGGVMELTALSTANGESVRNNILESILNGNISRTYSKTIFNEAKALCIKDTNLRWMQGFVKSEEYQLLIGEMTKQSSVVEAMEDNSLG